MSRYTSQPGFRHDAPARSAVLLINLGTPDAPTPRALRAYLKEFLWDPRVVEIPRMLWWLILPLVLATRPKRSAKLYQKIWLEEGSPLLVYSRRLVQALASEFDRRLGAAAPIVELAMRYGHPSMPDVLERLRAANVRKLVVLPLYPQYAGATSGSTFNRLAEVLARWRWIPDLQFISSYHALPEYIEAMADRVRDHWKMRGRGSHLLFSFHGLPRRSLELGDPYHCQCQTSARLLAQALELSADQWTLCFQSRFGRAEWLKPYTSETLQALVGRGVRDVDVFCPGFAADCLETLEEIALQNAGIFRTAGGYDLQYIPALNDSEPHVRALADLIERRAGEFASVSDQDHARVARLARAKALGATQ